MGPRIENLVAKKAHLQQALQSGKAELEEKNIELVNLPAVSGYVDDIGNVLSSSTITEQKTLLRSFISSIEVSRTEATINYCFPIPKLGTDREKVEVLDFGGNGRPNRTFANPEIKILFELSLLPARSSQGRAGYE